jgi:hypothetical protein
MGLKEVYLQWEDKWYGLLDKVDAHIPVYKLVDRIDKVVPSFLLFIILIVFIAGLFVAVPFLMEPSVYITISVVDTEGNLLPGVDVDYAVEGRSGSATTNDNGEISVFVPINSSVEIRIAETTVLGKEFEALEQSLFVADGPSASKELVLTEKAPAFVERAILFQDGSGERISGKAIKIRLSCENPLVVPVPTDVVDLDMDGKITVKEPKDCEILKAKILEPSEFAMKDFVISKGTQTIRLEEKERAKGSLRVRVKDESGNILVSNNFDVKVLDNDGLKVGEKLTGSYGEVIFSDVIAGTYTVSVEDDDREYAIASQPGVRVLENESTAVDVIVSKTVKARLNVSVVDKVTGEAIPKAVVRLVDSEKETVAEKTSFEGEDLVFLLTDRGNYTLFATHDDYLYEILELEDVSDEQLTIELEGITELNSGRVEVRVLDEDRLPVKNARVKLRLLDSGMLAPVEPEMSDSNGFARFVGVKEGSYYAYVEKFPAFGDNRDKGKKIDIRDVTKFTVHMSIGNSIVSVKTFDQDMLPVSEAEAEFFSEAGESLGVIPLTDGTGQFELKADKRVYVRVYHRDYMTVYTMPEQLWPSQTIEFSTFMEPRLIFGMPVIQFEGIFDVAGSQSQELKSGNRYTARFKLSIPEEGGYEKGGIHFRAGDEKLLINDPLVVREAFAGNIDAPLKGTSYTEPAGYDEDVENLTEGDAKWINIYWPELEPGNYYVGFEIRVKSQVTPYTRLPMHYRAWIIDESQDYIRAPEDSELGISESVSGKQALYAKTLDLAFLEGQDAECQDDFCYSGESILDEDDGLYVYDPYEVRSGAGHKLTFSILNNSLRQYENSELFVTVEGATIDAYNVQNAQAREISGEGVSVKAVEGIDLGAFTKGKSVSGEFHFVPSQIGNASVEIKVVADGRVVFLKEIQARVVSESNMKIYVDPEILPTYVPTDLQITVKEVVGEQEFELNDALVRVTVFNPDKTELFLSSRTNVFGLATISLPAALPNTIVKIEAEKPGYYADPVTLTVSGDVLSFTPDELEIGLDTRNRTEHEFVVRVENLTGIDMKIADVQVSGNLRGILDKQTMVNFSQQFIGTGLAGLDVQQLKMFKVKLNENAVYSLYGKEEIEGEFVVRLESEDNAATWDLIVPFKVDISIGGLPDNAPCITISKREWKAATQENRASIEFEIRNHCMSGQNFVDLENLQVKMHWTSDVLGTVELSVTEAETGASNTAVLRSLVWTPLFDRVRAEGVYYAILTFTPKAGNLGKRAEFEVTIDGEISTDSGPQFVGSAPKTVKAAVDIVNLEECIDYVDAETMVEIKASQDDSVFTIDTSKCGETELDIYLCYRDRGCTGGTPEGQIGVIPEQFSLNPGKATKEILVERRGIPGMYGLTVYAKMPGSSYRLVHTIDVLVHPRNDEAFYLDKYSFTILGQGARDSTVLVNTQLEEQVDVRASACAWNEASEKGNFDTGFALAGAGVGFALGALAPAGTFATIGPAFMGMAFCPPCLVIMAVLAAIGGLLGGMLGDDPCDKDITQPLPDWVINLKEDYENVTMSNAMIAAGWEPSNPKILGANEKQEVGLWFENLGIEEVEPTYAVAAVTAKKHHHTNPTDYGSSSAFGTYMVRDREVTVYEQKFHLKFDTMLVPQRIPPVSYDAYECVQGTLIGRTGPGSLPRTKLSWNWSDRTGIAMDACDYTNPDYIYCDASQFSMAISKRLRILDTFLEINRENFVCPTSPMQRYIEAFQEQYGTRQVVEDQIGLRQVTPSMSGAELEISFEIENDNISTQMVDVTVEVSPPSSVTIPSTDTLCERQYSVAGLQSKMGTCTFTGLVPSNEHYGVTVSIDGVDGIVDKNGFVGAFKVSEPSDDDCWIGQSTTLLDGKPSILYFFEESDSVIWTPEVPNEDALRELLYFKAYLMRDGYSEDFQQDFAEYALTKDFYNAPDWFSDNPDGKFADYFADPYYMQFTRRFVDSTQLPNAGLYDVLLDINFVGGDWDLFDAYSQPNAKIKVEFYLLKGAYPNNIFYYMPFNGNIGAETPNGRQGYGTDYYNVNNEVLVTKAPELVKTLNIAGSTPSMKVNTEVVRDFKKINTTASNRGFILSVEESGETNQKDLVFYPNYATPVMMRMSHEKSLEPFSAYYELRGAGTPVETSDNMTFWDGAGQCLDYTGVPVVQAFDFTPDREADQADPLENWQFSYAVDWTKADYGGDVYLKSVFYTPADSLFTLKALKPDGLRFMTANAREQQAVELNGIAGMRHNNVLGHESVDSMEDIFELVKEGEMCVISTGVRTAFWWNPKVLYEKKGDYSSIQEIEQGLVADQSCIGYGS